MQRRAVHARASTPGGWTPPSPRRSTGRSPRPRHRCSHQTHMNPTALGSGARMLNAYPLVNSPRRLRGPARGGARPARLHPDPQRLRRAAALRRRVVVGRHLVDLDGDAQADRRRARVLAVGNALLDDRHRRLLGAASASRTRRAVRPHVEEWRELNDALVPVRDFRPASARARPGAEARDVGVRRRRQPGVPTHAEVRPPALPPAAVPLLARGADVTRRGGDDHAPAGDGLSAGRRESPATRRSVHVRARVCWSAR